jgi:hypothetical protein
VSRLSELVDELLPVLADPDDLPLLAAIGSTNRTMVYGPLPDLLGWKAPSVCDVVMVVARVRAYPMTDGCAAGDAAQTGGGPQGGLLALALDRSGEIDSRLTLADGTELRQPPETGRILDALRRGFGLATPPPEASIHRYWCTVWMQTVAQADPSTFGSWLEVALAHPVVGAVVDGGGELSEELADLLIRGAGDPAQWGRVRRGMVEHPGWPGSLVDADVAAWMDDGMFCRHLVSLLPDLERVAGIVVALLPPDLGARLEALLADLDLAVMRPSGSAPQRRRTRPVAADRSARGPSRRRPPV